MMRFAVGSKSRERERETCQPSGLVPVISDPAARGRTVGSISYKELLRISRLIACSLAFCAAATVVTAQTQATIFQPTTTHARTSIPISSQYVYRIHCGTFDSQMDASLAESRLAVQGIGPVVVKQEGEKYAVYAGVFETNSEAWAYTQQMKNFGILNTKVARFDSEAAGSVQGRLDGSFTSLLIDRSRPVKAASADRVVLSKNDGQVRGFLEALEVKERPLAIASGLVLMEDLSNSDARKGRIGVDLARAIVQERKKSADALPFLLQINAGEIAADEETLIEARFLIADSWHYYWFAPLKAYRAYKEILEEHGDDPAIKTRCLVEMAACMLELARMPRAEWRADYDDARRHCLRILNEVPPSFRRAHAVADLMYCETFAFEAQDERNQGGHATMVARRSELYRQGIEAFTGFEERHPGRNREISMANHMMSWLLQMDGRWPEARIYIDKTLELDLSDPNEQFYWQGERWNVKRMAAHRGWDFAKEAEDEAAIAHYARLMEIHAAETVDIEAIDFAFPHTFYTKTEEVE